ncbi:MAG: polymer-forming cytoskeletal protein [Acidobacteria bacterium]|nr:polymer-forming cytoskeletal protein [Acidobacteriota bacterium]MCW5948329.1 polymer-forming cytoskeletal protein [Pyrinomonadaceae bacterium]
MIRMGRSSRADQPDAGTYTEQPAPTAPYMNTTDAPSVSSRAISESDSMARDIKEGRLSGFVGHGTTLTGETEFQAMLRVDGHLIGTVSSATGTLIVGTNGQVDANIAVAAAMINGTVNGDILATEKLQLGRTARVIGNIQAPRLVMEEGAVLEGSCAMLKARESIEKSVAAPAYEPVQAEPSYSADTAQSPDEATASLFAGESDEADEDETAGSATA